MKRDRRPRRRRYHLCVCVERVDTRGGRPIRVSALYMVTCLLDIYVETRVGGAQVIIFQHSTAHPKGIFQLVQRVYIST